MDLTAPPTTPATGKLQCVECPTDSSNWLRTSRAPAWHLVGDLMLDRYIFGHAERVSPEAPVPILVFQHEELRLGGAGSVAADLAALRADLRVVGIIGRDESGNEIRRRLSQLNANTGRTCAAPIGRPTVTKLRLVGSAQHRQPQQLIRLDTEDCQPDRFADGPNSSSSEPRPRSDGARSALY